MKVLALILAGLALVGTTPSNWRTFRAHGVSVRYPPKWRATAQPLTPVTSPAQVLAVASYPLPGNDRGADGCEPKQALDRLPPGGAFVYGWDYGDLTGIIGVRTRDFPPRPKRFTLRGFARYECLGASYMLRFREAHRFFQIHIAFGKRANAETRSTVLRILDSFHAKPL